MRTYYCRKCYRSFLYL